MSKVAAFLSLAAWCAAADYPDPVEGDFTIRDFHFHSGESLAELHLHYATLGKPSSPAILIMHGTGGSGHGFFSAQFAGELFGPGQPLDAAKYFIIFPDAIGHGKSSKPSDGMRMHFPRYDYTDMVDAELASGIFESRISRRKVPLSHR